jgi:hypothetical protein
MSTPQKLTHIKEMQGRLFQLLHKQDLTDDQRTAIKAGIEALDWVEKIAPGVRKFLDEQKKCKPDWDL